MSDKEQFTLFYTSQSPFSQFYPCQFTLDGQTFNCAEQYMMYRKAALFKDQEAVAAILVETKPGKIKALGRGVRGFDDAVWKEHRCEIVRSGNLAKFGQNEELKEALMATDGTTLVEASPGDRIYGIGLAQNDPLALDRANWRGLNLLGQILTEVREQLKLGA